MGVTILNALALVEGWRAGARFDATLTLGRLNCMMALPDLRRIARLLPAESEFVREITRGEPPKYADGLFAAMGAVTVDSMDASDFEGATIVHDLNESLPAQLHGRFDAVVDGGTLEHVFNVASAFKNAMDALKVGGYFFAAVPANNYCGHGFYQFSAELFYTVFSPANGFEMRQLLVSPAWVAGKWLDGPVYEVSPGQAGDRLEIEGKRKMLFLVQARKVSQQRVFAEWPQQGGYAAAWAPSGVPASLSRSAPKTPSAPMRAYRRVLNRAGGVGRVVERFRERRRWNRKSAANPVLKLHQWLE
jgi:SAM-dependent methyltransferase